MLLKEKILSLFVLLIALAALAIPIAVMESHVLQHTNGVLTYPQDNSFLNMAVAKNLAFNQVWGVSKYSFQSAAPSLLYTIVLAVVYFIAGTHLVIPLILNFLIAVFFLFRLQQWLVGQGVGPIGRTILLLLVIVLSSLPLLVISGMEYPLQLLLSFLFIQSFAAAVARTNNRRTQVKGSPQLSKSWHRWRRVWLYGALMVMTSYECSAIILVAGGILLYRREWRAALRLAAISFAPVLLFGLYSIHKGDYFLPNPLLLPSPAYAMTAGIWILTLMLAAWLFNSAPKDGKRLVLIRPGRSYWILGLVLALTAIPLLLRNAALFTSFQQEGMDAYLRQYSTAKFVQRYYNRYPVAVNQPGAISYWSEGRKFDFTGMANSEVTRSRRRDKWSTGLADSLCRKDNIRIRIESSLSSGSAHLPKTHLPRWNKVASWEIARSDSAGTESVFFYVVDTGMIPNFRKKLQEYQPSLPLNTIIRYY